MRDLDSYLNSPGLNADQCWRSNDVIFLGVSGKDAMPKLMPLFVEFVLKDTGDT